MRGCRGLDRMAVGFTTTYAIGAYHRWCEFESLSGWGVQQVGGFLQFSTNKTDCHDITEILLKVALNTIKQTKTEEKMHARF
jgi:hypothetical protein